MTDRHEEQAALYALHSLDEHDKRILQSEMKVDGRLREAISEFETSIAEVALLLPEEAPPGQLKDRLMAEVRRRRRSNVMSNVVVGMFRSPVVAWAAAAALACGAVFLWEGKKDVAAKIPALAASEASVRDELDRARNEKIALEKQLADATAQSANLTAEVARLKDANAVTSMEVATLRSSLKRYEEGVAVVVWDSQAQQGQLKMEKMPPVQPNKDYQLWVVDKGKAVPVDAGVVKVNSRGSATVTFKPVVPITDVSKFAISVEEAGGVPVGQGPIIMASP